MKKAIIIMGALILSQTTTSKPMEAAVAIGGAAGTKALDKLWQTVYAKASKRGFYEQCLRNKDDYSDTCRVKAAFGFGCLASQDSDKAEACVNQLLQMSNAHSSTVKKATLYSLYKTMGNEPSGMSGKVRQATRTLQTEIIDLEANDPSFEAAIRQVLQENQDHAIDELAAIIAEDGGFGAGRREHEFRPPAHSKKGCCNIM